MIHTAPPPDQTGEFSGFPQPLTKLTVGSWLATDCEVVLWRSMVTATPIYSGCGSYESPELYLAGLPRLAPVPLSNYYWSGSDLTIVAPS